MDAREPLRVTSVAFDTNILAYLAVVDRAPSDRAKIERIKQLVPLLGRSCALVAPTQALGELFVVLRRARTGAVEARRIVNHFANEFITATTDELSLSRALDLAVDHKLQFWDALILTAAADAGCSLLLSEDMQDGFVVAGLTVVNPLAPTRHPRLASLLSA